MQNIFSRGCIDTKWTDLLEFLEERRRVFIIRTQVRTAAGGTQSSQRACSRIFSFDPLQNPVLCGNYCYSRFVNKESLCKEEPQRGWMRRWLFLRNTTVRGDSTCTWAESLIWESRSSYPWCWGRRKRGKEPRRKKRIWKNINSIIIYSDYT